jgi:hypothetical protein
VDTEEEKVCNFAMSTENEHSRETDEKLYKILKNVFKYSEFKSKLQKEATSCVLKGELVRLKGHYGMVILS